MSRDRCQLCRGTRHCRGHSLTSGNAGRPCGAASAVLLGYYREPLSRRRSTTVHECERVALARHGVLVLQGHEEGATPRVHLFLVMLSVTPPAEVGTQPQAWFVFRWISVETKTSLTCSSTARAVVASRTSCIRMRPSPLPPGRLHRRATAMKCNSTSPGPSNSSKMATPANPVTSRTTFIRLGSPRGEPSDLRLDY